MISAEVICDSLSPAGTRLTTFVITFNRYILAELNTHRMLSRNSASSRAIPIKKMISAILKNPAKPVSWGANCKGMQSKSDLPKHRQVLCNLTWVAASWIACGFSWLLSKLGAHKQLANRVTEPFAHMTTILSGTDFENLFALRCHPDAQPEFQELAFKMLRAYLNSKPKQLQQGEWHLPFADTFFDLSLEERLKVVTARCARVSYLNFDGKVEVEKDFALHDDLLASGHMSPFEHAARAEDSMIRSGNLVGFTQYRKLFQNENRKMSREQLEQLLANWEAKQ